MTPVMTCTECLSLVATGGVDELTTSAAVSAHCRTCADCARVVAEVAEEERRLREALDEVAPGVPPGVVALRAVADSARARRRGARLRAAGAAGAVVVAMGAFFTIRSSPARPTTTAHVLVRCLDPVHAVQLTTTALPREIRPVVGLSVRRDEAIPVIHVSGPPDAVVVTEQLIADVEARYAPRFNPACVVEADRAYRPERVGR